MLSVRLWLTMISQNCVVSWNWAYEVLLWTAVEDQSIVNCLAAALGRAFTCLSRVTWSTDDLFESLNKNMELMGPPLFGRRSPGITRMFVAAYVASFLSILVLCCCP